MDNNDFNIDYFIDKFSKIPEKRWTTGQCKQPNDDKYCAFGHCGIITLSEKELNNNAEAIALINIMGGKWVYVTTINDMITKYGDTPKERIINKLKELKNVQNTENINS